VAILLMGIGGDYIDGDSIGGYFINGYWWRLY
jgi:hypothetical protein